MSETKSALIIANYRYEHPDLRQLVAPAQDAESLARVLGDSTIGGFEVRTVINEPSHKVNLEIESFCENRKRDDLLLIYFSGHGIKDADGQLYFATVDTQLVQHNVRRATAVSAHFVNEVMSRSRSRRQVLLLDCCYSGAFKQGMLAKGDRRVGAGEQFEGQGRIVLTASDALQYSFEGEHVEGEGARFVFTRTLVRGLETGEADLDRDGFFSLDELYDYIYGRVSDEQPEQKPTKMGYVEGRIFIGSNPHPLAGKLPPELQESLDDRRPWVRLGALQELEKLLARNSKGIVLAAQAAITAMAVHDDSLEVRTSAEKCLAAHTEGLAVRSEQAANELATEAARRARDEEERREHDRAEAERLAMEKRASIDKERVNRERAELEQAESERLALEKAEAERVDHEQFAREHAEWREGNLPARVSDETARANALRPLVEGAKSLREPAPKVLLRLAYASPAFRITAALFALAITAGIAWYAFRPHHDLTPSSPLGGSDPVSGGKGVAQPPPAVGGQVRSVGQNRKSPVSQAHPLSPQGGPVPASNPMGISPALLESARRLKSVGQSPTSPGTGTRSFTKHDILEMLAADVPSESVGVEARRNGIAFRVTPTVEHDLRAAGADDALLKTLHDLAPGQEVEMQQAGETNKKDGEDFLAFNKLKEGVVALPSGLQYKVLKEGSGPRPSATDTVVCNYRGTFLGGNEFDSSYKRGQPAAFPVDKVIKGWTEALQLMPVGSKWQLFIPPELAYGQRGIQGIAPNTTLIFEVELLSIRGKSN